MHGRSVIFVSALALAPRLAFAQSSPPPSSQAPADPEAEARRLFEEALSALNENRTAAAVQLLESARTLRATPAVLYNLALAQRSLGQYVESVEAFEAFLAAAPNSSRRAEVESYLQSDRASIAHVTLRVVGDGVQVTIDGNPVARERYARAIEMDPGRHTFVATGEGFQQLEIRRDIASGASTDVLLAPERPHVETRIRIAASVPTAEIFFDRFLVGPGRYEARIQPGQHDVEVRANGYVPYRAVVAVMPGQQADLHPALVRVVPFTARWWFWTGVSAVVVGAAGAITAVALSGPEAPVQTSTGTTFR